MKKLIYSLLIFLVLGTVFNSCKKDFLETYPTDAAPSVVAAETTTSMWIVINGIHSSLYSTRYQDAQGCGGIGAFMNICDIQGEDHVRTGDNSWYRDVYKWNVNDNPNTYYVAFAWEMFYRFIVNANILINDGPNATGPEEEKDAIIGQALVYRAWCHYNLVNMYAKPYVAGAANTQLGVPYMKEFTIEGQARNTVAEVYTNILADLDQAITLLEGYGRKNKSHINKAVAKGIKARVLLAMGNYTAAATTAADARAGYSLMSFDTYKNGFRIDSQNNPEFMWASQIVQIDQNDLWAAYGAYISRNFSSTAIRTNPFAINSLLYNKISATDVRKTLWSVNGKHDNLQPGVTLLSSFAKKPYTNQKFIAVSNSDSRVDVPLLRAAELYLIEAESLARLGQDANAAQVLYNFAITRDPAYTKSTKTGQALLDEILIQRRVELWGEGFRFFDLKRLNLGLDRTGANHSATFTGNFLTYPAGGNKWTWFIPQSEIDSNPLMVQNDF